MDAKDYANAASGYPYGGTQDQQMEWILDISELTDSKK